MLNRSIAFQNTIFVEHWTDLPKPVNNKITLKPDTKYLLFGTVTLPDGVYIENGLSSVFVGHNAPTDRIIGNVDNHLIQFVDDGSTVTGHLYYCSLLNQNTGSNATAQFSRRVHCATIPIIALTNPGDVFRLRFLNLESSTNVIFQTAGINVVALGI